MTVTVMGIPFKHRQSNHVCCYLFCD